MNPRGTGRGFLVSISLTELMMILFFLLLLTAAVQLARAQEDKERAEQRREVAEERATRLADEMERLEAVREEIQRRIDDDEDWMELVRDLERAHEVEQEREQLESALEEAHEREQAQRDSLQRFAEVLAEAGAQSPGEIRDAIEQLRRERRYFERRAGAGPPPCWLSPDGQSESVYRIVVGEQALHVQPAWPDHREDDVDRMPNARALAGRTVTLDEFRVFAQPIFDQSVRDSCRHTVRIADEARTKNGYKIKRQEIEEYFYKLEERR